MSKLLAHRRKAFRASAVDFDGFGNASRYFDGVSDYIDLGDSNDFSFGDGAGNDSPFSIAAWVKLDVTTGNRGIFSKFVNGNGEWLLFYHASSNEFRWSVYDTSNNYIRARSSVTINASQWYHVGCTYDGSKSVSGMKMYVNGSLDTTTETGGVYLGMSNTTTNCFIGQWAGANFIDGKVTDVRLYNSELSSTDIAAIYGGENITTNLVGHWLKDTPSLLDDIGTNDGTNVGSAFAYDNPSPAVEFGKASRVFDGNDHVDTNASFNTTFQSAFSFACWVRFADGTPASTNSIFGNQENDPLSRWLFLLGNDGKIQSNYHSNGNTSFAKINTAFSNGDTGWIHLACVVTPSGQTLYLNGSQATLDPTQTGDMSGVTMGDYDSTINCFIGARSLNNSSNLYLTGNIADVRIYNSELSSTDIASLYNGTNVETNLIGHWLTNTDDVNDYAGSNDGTNNGSTYSFDNPLGDSEFGSASRLFNGTSHYITVPDGSWLPTGAQTWACWIKVNVMGTDAVFNHNLGTGNQRSVNLITVAGGAVEFVISQDGASTQLAGTAASAITTGQWYHIAGTFEPNTAVKIYIDGVLRNTLSSGVYSSVLDSTADVGIGANALGQAPFDGKIADCRIYDTALTGTDIFDISRGYDYRTNLVGQWLTNKDDVDDYAGTNHGTNNGSTYSQDAPL